MISQTFHHVFCWRRNKQQASTFDENFIATPHQFTLRKKTLFLGFVFWSIETTNANLQGLTHSNPANVPTNAP